MAYEDLINDTATKYQLDPDLLSAVVKQESGGDPQAMGKLTPHGRAVGLMQLMPATAKDMGVTNRSDPAQSLDGGAKYLRKMLDKYNGNERLALAAYNAGPDNVDKYNDVPPFPETQNYVTSILTNAGRQVDPTQNWIDTQREHYSDRELYDYFKKAGMGPQTLEKYFPGITPLPEQPQQAKTQQDLPWYGKLGQGALDTLHAAVTKNLMIPGVEHPATDPDVTKYQLRHPFSDLPPDLQAKQDALEKAHPELTDPLYNIRGAIQQFRDDPWRALGGTIPFLAAGGASNLGAEAASATMRGAKGAVQGGFQGAKENVQALHGLPGLGIFYEALRHPTAGAGIAALLGLPGAVRGAVKEIGAPAAEKAAQLSRGDEALSQWVRQQNVPSEQQPRNLQTPTQPAPPSWAPPSSTEGLRPENIQLAQDTQDIRGHWAHRVAGELIKDGIKNISEVTPSRFREYATNAGYQRGAERGISPAMRPIIQDALNLYWRTRGRR